MKRIKRKKREGVALLVVLFVVMVITVLALGFMSRSDVELACGKNMILRTQMDHLAESGLEHARGLILSPQDVDTEYWQGDIRQQLVPGSDDYYDVGVVKLGECNYQITCAAYRERNGEKVGRSDLVAELRLDPCIALWTGANTTISQRVTINGDVYCNGSISGNGYVGGDVFATGGITLSNITGKKNEVVAEAPVSWSGLQVGDFSSTYYIGSSTYSTHVVDSNVHPGGNFLPSAGNPAGVRYCGGDVELPGNVNIKGMLVVGGSLRISGANNVISAVKNFPALLVGGEVIVEDGGTLQIEGLAQIAQKMVISGGAGNVDIDVLGALFIAAGGVDGAISDTVSVDITAGPAIAALQTWPVEDNCIRWTPVGGAFFRSIARE
jgi:cytoskeletal protein CcmA (bactofilin family)